MWKNPNIVILRTLFADGHYGNLYLIEGIGRLQIHQSPEIALRICAVWSERQPTIELA